MRRAHWVMGSEGVLCKQGLYCSEVDGAHLWSLGPLLGEADDVSANSGISLVISYQFNNVNTSMYVSLSCR